MKESQILANLLDVCSKENVDYSEDGLEAIVFTAQGDMRQALNNLQSTKEGFGFVNSENVFKVFLQFSIFFLSELHTLLSRYVMNRIPCLWERCWITACSPMLMKPLKLWTIFGNLAILLKISSQTYSEFARTTMKWQNISNSNSSKKLVTVTWGL